LYGVNVQIAISPIDWHKSSSFILTPASAPALGQENKSDRKENDLVHRKQTWNSANSVRAAGNSH
jgi:hypothetical protein